MGQAFAVNCLVVTTLKELQGSADQRSQKVAELHQKVENLQGETTKLQDELHQSKQEVQGGLRFI